MAAVTSRTTIYSLSQTACPGRVHYWGLSIELSEKKIAEEKTLYGATTFFIMRNELLTLIKKKTKKQEQRKNGIPKYSL